jgi:hypothetical protein
VEFLPSRIPQSVRKNMDYRAHVLPQVERTASECCLFYHMFMVLPYSYRQWVKSALSLYITRQQGIGLMKASTVLMVGICI